MFSSPQFPHSCICERFIYSIPRIGLPILLQPNRHVGIGNEAPQFHFWDSINRGRYSARYLYFGKLKRNRGYLVPVLQQLLYFLLFRVLWRNFRPPCNTVLLFLQTNTFQAVIVTDEVRAYAIFIYEWMGWTTHTEVRRV